MKHIFLQTTTSTNDDAINFICRSDFAEKMVIFAQHQTQGRGTRGRVWDSPKKAVLATLIYPLMHPISQYTGVTLSIGVAIARVLRQMGFPVQVKWPNDIICGGKKLAGILVEQAQSLKGQKAFVIGIGLNIELSAQYKDRIAINELRNLTPNEVDDLGECLIQAIDKCLQEFEALGFEPTFKCWSQYGAYAGRFVDVFHDESKYLSGQLKGINTQGSLIIVNSNGEHCVTSGTLRVRGEYDCTC